MLVDALFLCYSLTRSRWDVSVAGAGLVLSAKRGLVYINLAALHRLLVPFLHSGSVGCCRWNYWTLEPWILSFWMELEDGDFYSWTVLLFTSSHL